MTAKILLFSAESPDTIPGCYGDYGNPQAPNVCAKCRQAETCHATMEILNQ